MGRSPLEEIGLDAEQMGLTPDVQRILAIASGIGAASVFSLGLNGAFSEKPQFPLSPEQAAALIEAHDNFSVICSSGLSVNHLPAARAELIENFAPSGTIVALNGELTDRSEWFCRNIRDGRVVTSHITAFSYDGVVWRLYEKDGTLDFAAKKGVLGAKWWSSTEQ